MERFPAGLRVLVVDDDRICLKILERMLLKCDYQVSLCSRAMSALSLLREKKGQFDVIISDVHMPDMDGFKLLELVGLEMDLPVIMMSSDSSTSMVMEGIKHGACDYLIKPVRFEELRNIWQHVLRKKWNENRDQEHSSSGVDESDRIKRQRDDSTCASSVNTADVASKANKKRKDIKDQTDDGDVESDDPSSSKKPRVVWSVELHQQFVTAVDRLGIDKAVPKRILELMNVPGLTRENVASHLQKYRLYLKRLSGAIQVQGGSPCSFYSPVEASPGIGQLRRVDLQSLGATCQILPQTLIAMQGNLLDQSRLLDQPILRPHCQPQQMMSHSNASISNVSWGPSYPLTADGISKCDLIAPLAAQQPLGFHASSLVIPEDLPGPSHPVEYKPDPWSLTESLGFVESGAHIPSQFTVNGIEQLGGRNTENLGNGVWIKQEDFFPDLVLPDGTEAYPD